MQRISILPESFSPNDRDTISIVRSNMQHTESGYIVRLPFKDDTRSSVNYRTARRQLNQLIHRVENEEQFGQQYDKVVKSYIEKEFIKQILINLLKGIIYHIMQCLRKAPPLHYA